MELPNSAPFHRLELPPGEAVLWHGFNPTFHRGVEYGAVLTDVALYWYKSPWSLGRWRRFPLVAIRSVEFENSGLRPAMRLDMESKVVRLHTPHDSYGDEMDFDRKVLAKGVAEIRQRLGGASSGDVSPNTSLERTREG